MSILDVNRVDLHLDRRIVGGQSIAIFPMGYGSATVQNTRRRKNQSARADRTNARGLRSQLRDITHKIRVLCRRDGTIAPYNYKRMNAPANPLAQWIRINIQNRVRVDRPTFGGHHNRAVGHSRSGVFARMGKHLQRANQIKQHDVGINHKHNVQLF